MLTNTFYVSSYPAIIFLIHTNANLCFLSLLFPVVIVPANTYLLLSRSTRHAYLTLLLLEPLSLMLPPISLKYSINICLSMGLAAGFRDEHNLPSAGSA